MKREVLPGAIQIVAPDFGRCLRRPRPGRGLSHKNLAAALINDSSFDKPHRFYEHVRFNELILLLLRPGQKEFKCTCTTGKYRDRQVETGSIFIDNTK